MHKISVIMPSFNYERYLNFAISGVLSQSYGNLELIITDDCSTDASRDIIDEWRSRDSRVLPVLHTHNRGLAAARNSGLAAASGEFIAFCDSDDIWMVDKLRVQMECFQKFPSVGGVHSDAAIINGNGELTGQLFSSLYHRSGQVTSGRLFRELCLRNFLCVPTVIIRREAMQCVGGFEESLRSLEDWVCWTKVSQQFDFLYVDDALAQYRCHGSGLSANVRNMAQNRVQALRLLLDSLNGLSPEVRAHMLYSLGVSHSQRNELRDAVQAFMQSLRADATHARSWVRCGQCFILMALQHFSSDRNVRRIGA